MTTAQATTLDNLRHGDSLTGEPREQDGDVIVATETGPARILPDGTMLAVHTHEQDGNPAAVFTVGDLRMIAYLDTDGDGTPFLHITPDGCDLEGEMPGVYYPVATAPTATRWVVSDLQACEPDSLTTRDGITILRETDSDEMGFPRVAVYGTTRDAVADYVRENWGDDAETGGWYSEFVLARIERVEVPA